MHGSDLHDAGRKARAARLLAAGAAQGRRPPRYPWTEPIQRSAEIVCGLLVTMLFTGAFAVLGNDARTVALSALAAGAAWSLLCALLFLRRRSLSQRSRQQLCAGLIDAPTPEAVVQRLQQELPESLAAELHATESHRLKALAREAQAQEPTTAANLRAAAAVLLLVFAGTLPVALPLFWSTDVTSGLAVAHGLAIALLFVLGGFLGHHAGLRPVLFAASLASLGALLAGLCWWLQP